MTRDLTNLDRVPQLAGFAGLFSGKGGMTMAAFMPKIATCEMSGCSYNKNKKCKTVAITVGRSRLKCDTYFKTPSKGGVADLTGSVSACKVEDCKYNKSFVCSASRIDVGVHRGHPDCVTYAPR